MITLLDGEKIILIKRRHWFIIALEALCLFSLALLPFMAVVILYLVSQETADFLRGQLALALFLGAGWLQLLWMIFFTYWTNYYLDVFLITNKRLIDIEQIGLFSRDTVEVRIENIQDIKAEMLGLVDSFFNMGNLHIQTAGQSKEIFLKNIPSVHEARSAIAKCCEEISKEKSPSTAPR